MTWTFDFAGMRHARLREHIRLACYARAAVMAGYDAEWGGSTSDPGVGDELVQAILTGVPRAAQIPPPADRYGVYVCSSEAIIGGSAPARPPGRGRRVVIACNGKRYPWYAEKKMAEWADVVMCGHHTEKAEQLVPGKFLPICHPVSEHVLRALRIRGLLVAYLKDDLALIRGAYNLLPTKAPGFIGSSEYGRGAIAEQFPQFEFRWDHIPAEDYLMWIADHEAVFDLPGQINRTFRFTETVMMGRPVIVFEPPVCTPAVTHENAIVVERNDRWGSFARICAGVACVAGARIVAAADAAYRDGWSILGQIRQLARALQ